jgi:uncharacterized caspase-like protein
MRRFLSCALSLLVGLLLTAFAAGDAVALRRVALIVGNAKYEHAGVLANTLNDSHAVAALLKRAGFDVVDERVDLGVVEMKRAVRDFTATANNADISVIYYSGHGLEASGVNYLIPVDAKLATVYDVEDETLPLDRLLYATANVKSLSLVILDACRENPFLRSANGPMATRALVSRAIGEQPTTANTLIAYAAKAGSLSYDGTGPNSPFTSALIKYIAQPGIDIRIALGKVRDDVLASTGDRQEPFVYGSLGGETVSLAPGAAAVVADRLAPAAADYAAATRMGSAEALDAFIDAHHEGGFYVDLARDQLNRMKPQSAARPTPVAAPPSPAVQVAKASPPSDADPCRTESARLQSLRGNPSPEAVTAFAGEMTCAALRPQLARLMESAGISAPAALAAPAPAMTRLASRTPDAGGCPGEVHELEALRAEPDVAQARALDRRLTCAALRPQLERLLESLGEAPTGSGRAIQVTPPPPDDPAAACASEAGELTHLRAHPDLNATRAFAAALRCKALAPQTARLLESLND